MYYVPGGRKIVFGMDSVSAWWNAVLWHRLNAYDLLGPLWYNSLLCHRMLKFAVVFTAVGQCYSLSCIRMFRIILVNVGRNAMCWHIMNVLFVIALGCPLCNIN